LSEERPGEIGVLVEYVSPWDLFTAFSLISVRSWGGGPATIYVMSRDLVARGWITAGQYALDFGLSRLVPGINLLAVAVILGYRLGKTPGAIAALFGLMFPASAITIALTLGFVTLTQNPLGDAVVRGIVPVTAVLTFVLAYEQGREVMPLDDLRTSVLMIAYAVASFFLTIYTDVSVALVIVVGIVIGAFLYAPRGRSV
jgi:chromate transporter